MVDFENCYKTRICVERSAPIQPKTNKILPKIGNYPTGPLPYGVEGGALGSKSGAGLERALLAAPSFSRAPDAGGSVAVADPDSDSLGGGVLF